MDFIGPFLRVNTFKHFVEQLTEWEKKEEHRMNSRITFTSTPPKQPKIAAILLATLASTKGKRGRGDKCHK